MSFLCSVFQLLILPPSVCLHAPFTLVYVHWCVCVCVCVRVSEWVSVASIYWLHAKPSSPRPLMGLKYPPLALTSILRSGCHLSVSGLLFSRTEQGVTLKSTLKQKLYIYYFQEFDHDYLQLKLHISSGEPPEFHSLSLSGVSGNTCTSVFGWNKLSSASFPLHVIYTYLCVLF